MDTQNHFGTGANHLYEARNSLIKIMGRSHEILQFFFFFFFFFHVAITYYWRTEPKPSPASPAEDLRISYFRNISKFPAHLEKC